MTTRPNPLCSHELLEDRTVPTTFTVNSLADDGVGVGDTGDLRYVIVRANTLNTGTPAAPDVIDFSGVTITADNHTIRVGTGTAGATPLPAIRAAVVIDGTTADGFDNLAGVMVTLNGAALTGEANGLRLKGGNATVQGLEIRRFPGHGILVESAGNTIGGDEVGVNAEGARNNPSGRDTTPPGSPPVTPVVVRPPEGNVIAANGRDGVRIEGGGGANFLYGNFIGTDVAGTTASANGGNGVTVRNSDNNQILGTVAPDQDNPFVFYNVISGNTGNGLVVNNSDGTVIYANFFGLGADNNTPVGNGGNGVVIKGDSDGTKFGGNIPLGNVSAANAGHGVVVTDTASRTFFGNTFGGNAAFNPGAAVGNGGNGILVTSTGGGKFFGKSSLSTIILTCNIAGNDGNGIEISGNAAAVQVSQSVIGMETNGGTPQPNRGNGILVGGNATGIAIGGFEPSVAGVPEDGSFLEAANLISGNLLNGIAVGGNATNVVILNSRIGTDISGTLPASNRRHGILLDGASGVQIGPVRGSTNPRDPNLIAFNARDGVAVRGGRQNAILGNAIFENGRLGIEHIAGGNNDQPAPLLTSVEILPAGLIVVDGTLVAKPSTTYRVEIFSNRTFGPNGRFFLGFVNVTTNASGTAAFTGIELTNTDPTGANVFTATATGPSGNTSEFSDPIAPE